jgi:carbon starvation protein CstA
VSGFHALISSGTTPKMIENEQHDTRFIGYGGMLMESFVAIMALVAAFRPSTRDLLRHEQPGGAARHHRRERGCRKVSRPGAS